MDLIHIYLRVLSLFVCLLFSFSLYLSCSLFLLSRLCRLHAPCLALDLISLFSLPHFPLPQYLTRVFCSLFLIPFYLSTFSPSFSQFLFIMVFLLSFLHSFFITIFIFSFLHSLFILFFLLYSFSLVMLLIMCSFYSHFFLPFLSLSFLTSSFLL